MCFISLDISYRCIQYLSFSVWFISLYLTFSGLIHISGHVSEFHTLSWMINVPLYAYTDFVLYLNEIILIFSFVSGSFVQYYIWDISCISTSLIEIILTALKYSLMEIAYFLTSLLSIWENYKFGPLWLLLLCLMVNMSFYFLEHIYFSVKFLIIYSVSLGTLNDPPDRLVPVFTPTITEDSSCPTTSPNLAFLFHFAILLSG